MNRIKEVIKEKGLTITSLADKLGIARESQERVKMLCLNMGI